MSEFLYCYVLPIGGLFLGRVASIQVPGLDLWFNSSDHEPPHFHVRRAGAWEIRVFFRTCTQRQFDYNVRFLLRGPGPSRRERNALLKLVLAHQNELYAEWEAKVTR